MFATIRSIFKNKEVLSRILFTLGMLFIFRLGAQIPAPNVDVANIGDTNNMIAMMNLLGGGALDKMSVLALGVSPYITASIITQLLSMDVIPHFTELAKSGQQGKRTLDKYTRYLAVILAFIQGYTMTYVITDSTGASLLINDSLAGHLYVATVFTAGTFFLLWIADRISTYGIGNGVSMIIFAGIVSGIPYQFAEAFRSLTSGATGSAYFNGVLTFCGFLLIYLLIIVLVIFIQTATRKIPIQYTSSGVSMKRRNDMTYLPLKINSASVIPVIFASAVMISPITIIQLLINNGIIKSNEFFVKFASLMNMQSVESLAIYVVLIILFTFFYTKLVIEPEKVAENLQKSGVYIPGVRPGKETKEYIDKVLSRITVLGAISLAVIAILPHIAPMLITSLPNSIQMGGTGLIIVVGVAMETASQIESKLTQKSYHGFLGSGR